MEVSNIKESNSIQKEFARYVSLNILGMMGISFYVLADSFFIAKAAGANGLAALSLVLPVYSFIFAIGNMMGVGSAIRFTIGKMRDDKECETYFSNAIIWAFIIGGIFSLIGLFMPDKVLTLFGADKVLLETGTSYTRIFMSFAPVFMWNSICNAFVRNDNAPLIAMLATFLSSIFNVVFDYILMFPLHMGMNGAALATALSPVLGIIICSIHLLSKKSTVRIKLVIPRVKKLVKCCKLGVSAFIGEFSNSVITIVYNSLILFLAGNVGVAAYSIIANVALVSNAVFNGISNGSQPLVSRCYGKQDKKSTSKLKFYSYITAIILAFVMYIVLYFFKEEVVSLFNDENNTVLASYAIMGCALYFLGIFFAGINIICGGVFSAVEDARGAFIVSVLRGFVLIILAAILLAKLFGMKGIWLSYLAAEAMTSFISFLYISYCKKKKGY